MIERSTRHLLFALALLVVLVQTLGALHRLLHVGHGVAFQVSSWEEKNTFSALWGEHGKASDCQSFDQVSPDALQGGVVTSQAVPLPSVLFVMVLQERFSLSERFFAARGPPVALI